MSNPPKDTKATKQKKTIQKILAGTAIALLIITALVIFFQRRVKNSFSTVEHSGVKTVQVTTGSIHTTVSASGTLASVDVEDVKLPAVVKLDTIFAESGDVVEAGQLLATVQRSSVLTALSDVQDQLSTLDTSIRAASGDRADAYIRSSVNGRVKALFAKEGDDVKAVMYEQGALALLSLDGKMKTVISAQGYQSGDAVTVEVGGVSYEGRVGEVSKDGVTVTLTDDGPAYGAEAKVDGKFTGTLEINQPMKLTGYAGTVSFVSAKENGLVFSGTNIYTLKDTGFTAKFDQLLEDRREYEEVYQRLVKLYQDNGIVAPMAGTVVTVNDPDAPADTASSAAASAAAAAGYAGMAGLTGSTASAASTTGGLLDDYTLATIDPSKTMSVDVSVDETDILSLALGQEVSITVDSIGKERYKGTVTEIDTTAVSSAGVTMYGATITLDRAERMLPGMTADIDVTIEGVENAMLVPEEAVHKTSAYYYVFTTYDYETGTYGGMKEVTVGISNGDQTEITGGLNVGDTVFYQEKEKNFFFGMYGPMGPMNGSMGGSRGNSSGSRSMTPMG